MHSFAKLISVDLGFDSRGVLSFDLVLPDHYLAERKLDIADAVASRLAAPCRWAHNGSSVNLRRGGTTIGR